MCDEYDLFLEPNREGQLNMIAVHARLAHDKQGQHLDSKHKYAVSGEVTDVRNRGVLSHTPSQQTSST